MDAAAMGPGLNGPGNLNQNFFSEYKDLPRGRMRVKVLVHNRNTLALQLADNLIGPGDQTITCYDDDAAVVLALVEDPKLIAAAQEQYRNDIAEEVGRRMGDNWTGTAAQMRALIESKTQPDVNEALKYVLETTGKSVQAAFQAQNKRSMLPLDRAEIVAGTEQPEPQRAATVKEVEKQADAIATALDRVLGKYFGGAGAVAQMSPEQIKALVSEQIETQLGGKGTGKR